MTTNSINAYSTRLRLTGLGGSGLDTDQIVQNLMKVERVPLDKLYQKKQLAEWKRDDYRSIINLLRGMKDEFFNILKPSTNMLSQSSYKKFTNTSSNSSIVTVSANADATAGSHKITVNNLATANTVMSSGTVTKSLQSSSALTTGAGSDVVNAGGKTIKVTLDGVTKEITMGNYTAATTVEDVATDLQNAIGLAFGAGKVSVTVSGGTLIFNTMGGATRIMLNAGSTNDGLAYLHFAAGDTNRLNISDTLDTLRNKLANVFSFDGSNNVVITVNAKQFTFSKDTTLANMMNTISSDPSANVFMKYDEITDRFVFMSKTTGSGTSVSISETGSTFFSAAGFRGISGSTAAALNYTGEKFNVVIDGVAKEITLNGSYLDRNALAADLKSKIESAFTGKSVTVGVNADNSISIRMDSAGSTLVLGDPVSGTSALTNLGFGHGNYIAGKDASVILDGQALVRSSNTFAVGGITYNLLSESGGKEVTVTLTQDISGIYDNIKKFVDKYNEVIDTINKKLSEKYDRDYQPLTQEQKDAMKEDEIKKWEEKAKTGLLRNDALLQNIVYNMRKALYDSIEGVGISLSSIGITTGNYEEKGKLVIDETKLKEAIQSNPDGVMDLFSKQSTSVPTNLGLTAEQYRQRYSEEGVAYRLYDIIEDNIRTVGEDGYLIKKAGMEGDSSEFNNVIYNEIKGYNQKIDELTEKLIDKENKYYEKFTALEKMLLQMNSQSSWLYSQFNMGQ